MQSDYCEKSSPTTKNPSQLMDTEPGGENTPYESQQIFGTIKTNNVSNEVLEQRPKLGSDPPEVNDTKPGTIGDLDHDRETVQSLGKANQGSAFGKVSSDKAGG
ncbi:hypothetical protein K3495_g13466 [Podosphaera aphanis]|nr:hypothetical protein K3495_g13466 [Podosphaera aphanis]